MIAYLCGSVPFGYLLVRLFRGTDIRATGSGNIGATNVGRTAPGLGIATLILDAAKGVVPVLLARKMFVGDNLPNVLGMAALFAILGHLFPVWLKFRGGKGVATGVGAFLAVAPRAVAIVVILFLVVLAASRFVSLASVVSTAAFPLVVYFISSRQISGTFLLTMVLASTLIIAKHHQNIRRLIAGTESKFGKAKVQALAKED